MRDTFTNKKCEKMTSKKKTIKMFNNIENIYFSLNERGF